MKKSELLHEGFLNGLKKAEGIVSKILSEGYNENVPEFKDSGVYQVSPDDAMQMVVFGGLKYNTLQKYIDETYKRMNEYICAAHESSAFDGKVVIADEADFVLGPFTFYGDEGQFLQKCKDLYSAILYYKVLIHNEDSDFRIDEFNIPYTITKKHVEYL